MLYYKKFSTFRELLKLFDQRNFFLNLIFETKILKNKKSLHKTWFKVVSNEIKTLFRVIIQY